MKLHFSSPGNIEVEFVEAVEPYTPYHLDLKRFGHRAELRVNGKKVPSRGKLAPFLAGTNLFIGGTAPGISVNSKIGGAAPFEGCINKVF